MIDKELDEAIALYDSGKLCNTGGKCNDVAWQAARELQSLKNGTHPEMVLYPKFKIHLGKNIGGYEVTGYEAAARKDGV